MNIRMTPPTSTPISISPPMKFVMNHWMTGAMKPPAAPVTAWACARSGASSTAAAASAAVVSAHAWRSKGFVLLITIGSSW
jgi:hypothetical protein